MSVFSVLAQLDYNSLPNHGAVDPTKAGLAGILSIVFAVTGSLALLVIVIGGFRYVLAHGDPNSVAQAKKAILYAIIGLLVSLAAFSIVTFVLQRTA